MFCYCTVGSDYLICLICQLISKSCQIFRCYISLLTGCLFAQLSFGHAASNGVQEYQVEYFKAVQFTCELDETESEVINEVYLWILPSGEVLRPNGKNTAAHVLLKDDGTILEVTSVDDEQFGLYICIVDTGKDIQVIKRGLNVDGPYYGPDHDDDIRRKAMIGGICACAVLILLISIWIIRSNFCKTKKKINSEMSSTDVENGVAINQQEKTPSSAEVESADNKNQTIIDEVENLEKIYDQADGILVQETKNKSPLDDKKYDKLRISQMDSGEYHTITELNPATFIKNSSHSHVEENDTGCDSGNNDFNAKEPSTDATDMNDDTKNDKNVKGNGNIDTDTTLEASGIFTNASAAPDKGKSGTQVSELSSPNALQNGFDYDDNESVDMKEEIPGLDTAQAAVDNEAEAVYAVPNKQKRTDDKEPVVIVEGEVIIENSGAKIIVTSAPCTQVITSNAEDVMANRADTVLTDGDATFPPAEEIERLDLYRQTKSSENTENCQNGKTDVGVDVSVVATYDSVLDKLRTTNFSFEDPGTENKVDTHLASETVLRAKILTSDDK